METVVTALLTAIGVAASMAIATFIPPIRLRYANVHAARGHAAHAARETRQLTSKLPRCVCGDWFTEHDRVTGKCWQPKCACRVYLGPDPVLSGLWMPALQPASTSQPGSMKHAIAANQKQATKRTDTPEVALRQVAEAFERSLIDKFTAVEVAGILRRISRLAGEDGLSPDFVTETFG